MSITRLQQARQMYAMGQRVGRIAFGGGSNMKKIKGQDHMLAYITPGERDTLVDLGGQETMTPEGILAYPPEGNYGSEAKGPGSGPGKSGITGAAVGGGNHVGNDPSTGQKGTGQVSGPDSSHVSDTQQYNHYEAMNQYNPMKEDLLPGDVPKGFIKPEDAVKLGLNLRPYEQQRVDFLNTPYKPVNLPSYVPGGMLINTVGNFLGNLGYKKNTQFFADNVAGKYGYGYGEDAYKDYMKKRMAGQVNAYGRPLTEGELRLRDGDGGGDNGIMDVYNNPNEPDDGDADGDGDSDQDDFIFRYFDKTGETLQAGAGGVEDLMTQIRKRISNIF